MASSASRKTPIRAVLGLFFSFIVFLVFVLQVRLVERFESNAPHHHPLLDSNSYAAAVTNSGATQPTRKKKKLKKTSVHRKKPPPPIYSNESFVDCKLLRPNDYIYEYGPWDGAPIVIESHKLVFFSIPKVGSTVLKQFFRRMEGYLDYLDDKHPLPHAPKRNGLTYLYDYPPLQAESILTDPSYTRAIFFRDPKERLLSAYLDKATQNQYVQFHCCDKNSADLYKKLDCAHPRKRGPAASQANTEKPLLSFQDFLSLLIPNCKDPHWEPQANRMENKYWKYINFVGHMNSVEKDTRLLLERIGAWDEFGATGWPNGHVFAGSATVSHKTGSSKRIQEYFTRQVEQLAEPLLQRDYQVWNKTQQ